MSLQGRKLYCVPSPASKEAVATRVCKRMGIDLLMIAGDWLLDAGILELADIEFKPVSEELHDIGFARPHLTVNESGASWPARRWSVWH